MMKQDKGRLHWHVQVSMDQKHCPHVILVVTFEEKKNSGCTAPGSSWYGGLSSPAHGLGTTQLFKIRNISASWPSKVPREIRKVKPNRASKRNLEEILITSKADKLAIILRLHSFTNPLDNQNKVSQTM